MIGKKGFVNVQEVGLQDENDTKTRNIQIIIGIETLDRVDIRGTPRTEAKMREGTIDGAKVSMYRIGVHSRDDAGFRIAHNATTCFVHTLLMRKRQGYASLSVLIAI